MPLFRFSKIKGSVFNSRKSSSSSSAAAAEEEEAYVSADDIVIPEITIPDETMTADDPNHLFATKMGAMEMDDDEPLSFSPSSSSSNRKKFFAAAALLSLLFVGLAATLAVTPAALRMNQNGQVQLAYNSDVYDDSGRQVIAYIPQETVNRALLEDSGDGLPYSTVNTTVEGRDKVYTMNVGKDLMETEQIGFGVVQYKNLYKYQGYDHTPDTFYYLECNTILSITNSNCAAYIQETTPYGYTYADDYSDRFLKNGPLCKKDDHKCSHDHQCCSDDCFSGQCECFSASTTVHVKKKKNSPPHSTDDVVIVQTPMNLLQVGDLVMVNGNGKFQRVYGFAHESDSAVTKFLQVYVKDADVALEMTPSHLAYIVGKPEPVPASSLKVGDYLDNIVDGEKEIVKIESITRNDGLYAPLTMDGTIVVNDMVMSTYALPQCLLTTTSNDDGDEEGDVLRLHFAGFSPEVTHERIHLFLSPLRVFCEAFPSTKTCQEQDDSTGLNQFLLRLREGFSFLSGQNIAIQLSVMVLAVLVIIFAIIVEQMMTVFSLILALFTSAPTTTTTTTTTATTTILFALLISNVVKNKKLSAVAVEAEAANS